MKHFISAVMIFTFAAVCAAQGLDPVDKVNTFIGTAGRRA